MQCTDWNCPWRLWRPLFHAIPSAPYPFCKSRWSGQPNSEPALPGLTKPTKLQLTAPLRIKASTKQSCLSSDASHFVTLRMPPTFGHSHVATCIRPLTLTTIFALISLLRGLRTTSDRNPSVELHMNWPNVITAYWPKGSSHSSGWRDVIRDSLPVTYTTDYTFQLISLYCQ